MGATAIGNSSSRFIDKRLIITIILTLCVGFGFWFGSRIPNLSEKATMGGDSQLEPLGFDTVLVIEAHHSFPERVIYTTVNWVDTNKRGMTFGVIFAALLMTFLSLIQKKSFRSGLANALMGTVIGIPLGVCVNCAAPIAKGLHAAGTRLETTLATMISSPTMNAIVLTMLFAMFPWYLIATKLAFTIFFIVVCIPIIVRMNMTPEERDQVDLVVPGGESVVCELPIGGGEQSSLAREGSFWGKSALWFLQAFPVNLWHIVKTTVPLMFLAGFLGALMIQALPWSTLANVIPTMGGGPVFALLAMALIAMVGTFLPVPIAFDVIVVTVLLASGMPVKYAMVLLFTLGIFSVYSFQITWRYISRPVAVTLFLTVGALGVVSGGVAHVLAMWDEARQEQAMLDGFAQSKAIPPQPQVEIPPAKEDGALVAQLQYQASALVPLADSGAAGISIESQPQQLRAGGGVTAFERVDGDVLGIDEPAPFSLLRILPPRWHGRGIATGDVHNDGWPDVLLAAENIIVKGISLYANDQGKGFIKQSVDVPEIADLEVYNAALVDINNDGWLDMFISTYRGGKHIVYNRGGRFTREGLYTLPEDGSILTSAVSFGDVDLDGDLDIVLGNWSLGYFRNMSQRPGEPAISKNTLLIQENGEFKRQKLDSFPGDSLASILSDFDGDGKLDLIIGNDFETSDVYYYGDGTGNFRALGNAEGKLPYTPDSTMSVHTADIDNDLTPEIFLTQVASGEGAGFASEMLPSSTICEEAVAGPARSSCLAQMELNEQVMTSWRKRDALQCQTISDPLQREDCLALHVLWAAWMREDPSFCQMIPDHRKVDAAICADIFGDRIELSDEFTKESIPQIRAHNVLLIPDGRGGYTDQAVEQGVALTGWSWGGKFADLDNDEWQDLYVATGLYNRDRRERNYLFMNRGGKGFDERTQEMGMLDYRATTSYSYVDYDLDGDMDIISVPVHGPIRIFINRTESGNSLSVALRDGQGNRFGIGSKITIHYGPDGNRHQMREIQASGGFMSFDAPVAHFGLGEHEQVQRIEILWSTGELSVIDNPLEVNKRYVISRGGQDYLAITEEP